AVHAEAERAFLIAPVSKYAAITSSALREALSHARAIRSTRATALKRRSASAFLTDPHPARRIPLSVAQTFEQFRLSAQKWGSASRAVIVASTLEMTSSRGFAPRLPLP